MPLSGQEKLSNKKRYEEGDGTESESDQNCQKTTGGDVALDEDKKIPELVKVNKILKHQKGHTVKYWCDTIDNNDHDNEIQLMNKDILGTSSCFDKRVSRTHGQLHLTPDGNVQLIALHSNPCFVMKNGLPPVIPLTKNGEKILNNGDYIGLLPDSFWYKIVVNKNESVNVSTSISNDLKSDTETKKDCCLAETTIKITSDSDADNANEPQPGSSEMELDSALAPDVNDKNVAEKVNSNDSLEEKLKALEHTKKLPLYMYEIDDFPEESFSTSITEASFTVVEEISKHNAKENEEWGKGDPLISSTSEDNSQLHDQSELYNIEDNEKDLNSSKASVNSNEAKQENTPHASNGLTVNASKKNGNNSKSPDCPDSQTRPLCQYEGRCYRKNSQHKKDYCHPGDPDFVPYENRPMCQFGSSCYRQNKSHLIEYRHPKKKSPATDSPKRKRRKRETNYRDASGEDDYDLEDPFINDGSSDEYIPSDFDSDEEVEDLT